MVLNDKVICGEEFNGDINMSFYVDDNGNVHLDGSNESQSSSQGLLANQTISNKMININSEEAVSNNRILKDITNLTKNKPEINDNVPSQFKDFLFWPKDVT